MQISLLNNDDDDENYKNFYLKPRQMYHLENWMLLKNVRIISS